MSKKKNDSRYMDTIWGQIEKDVTLRIRFLRNAVHGLKDHPANDKIIEDLVVPNLRLLTQFCENVKFEDED